MTDKASFFTAIKAGDLAQLKDLLDSNAQLLSERDENGVSAILVASYHGQNAIADELLIRGVVLDIWEASALGKVDRVIELLDRKPTMINEYTPDGFQPLGLAAFFGHLPVIDVLLSRGADANAVSKNPMKVRPLHSAVAHRDPAAALAMAEHLLEKGAEVNVAQHGGWTPLHQAAAHGHLAMAKLLLRFGADAEAKSDDGRTPLDMSIEGNYQDVAALLEESFA